MQETGKERTGEAQAPYVPLPLSRIQFLGQVLYGIGVTLGLSLLWLMETVRDAFFRTLDRLNIKPSHRTRVSAFPPGQPRKRPQSPA
jgi:hypothetical protein